MNCPHCRRELPFQRPSTDPARCKLHGHHGEMDLDMDQLRAMAECAAKYQAYGREIRYALDMLSRYQEVAGRMEIDPVFAEHVLSYDGGDGWRWFPGAARQARIAAIKERFASGRARKDDLVRYMELVDPR